MVKEVLFYCNVSTKSVSKIAPQKIDYYDLTFVLKGNLTYIIDGKPYILHEKDAILLKPETLRERIAENHQAKYVSFNFLLNEDIAIENFLKGIINSEIEKLISVFPQRHLSDSFHSKEKTQSILNYILYEIIDNAGYKSQNQHIIKILKYIEAHLSQNLSLKEISDYIGLTKEYTAYLFKKEIGKTIIDYINERKMIIAKNMIDSGQASLKDVALSLGFENYSYFSKLFKKYYDSAPVKRRIRKR
jgi:YesN/AraC family two-component response regulator